MTTSTPATPNFFDMGVIPVDVRKQVWREMVFGTVLNPFMGTSQYSPIQQIFTNKHSGVTQTVSLVRELDFTKTVNEYDQISGAEQVIRTYTDQVTLHQISLPVKLQDTPYVEQMSAIDIFGQMRPLLTSALRRRLVKDILDAACGLPVNGGVYNPAVNGNLPSYDRAIAAGALNGIANRNAWNNTNLNGVVAAMNAGTAYNQNGLSVQHIRSLKSLAIAGCKTDLPVGSEKSIMPLEILSMYGFPMPRYTLLIDPESYSALLGDPMWGNYIYRGVIQNSDQPQNITGAFYRGMVDGVMVYEVPELARYRITSGGFTSAWNLFLGGQALILAYGQMLWFEEERRNYNTDVSMAGIQIRGQKMTLFPSYRTPAQQLEHGLIHSLTRIV